MKNELEFLVHQQKAKQLMVAWESLGIIEESKDIDEQSNASF